MIDAACDPSASFAPAPCQPAPVLAAGPLGIDPRSAHPGSNLESKSLPKTVQNEGTVSKPVVGSGPGAWSSESSLPGYNEHRRSCLRVGERVTYALLPARDSSCLLRLTNRVAGISWRALPSHQVSAWVHRQVQADPNTGIKRPDYRMKSTHPADVEDHSFSGEKLPFRSLRYRLRSS
jgi:hypothetical protein